MPALFEAYVTNLGKYNEGELVGEYLKFPTTPEEVQALLKRIGIDGVRYEEIFITDFDGDVLGLYDHLGEYENIDELNHLACVISELDQGDLEKFEAVIDSGEYTGSVKELINLAQNLDCFEFYPGVTDDETLGRIYVEDMEATIGNLGFFIKGAPLSKADISKTGTPFILYGELYTTYHEVITSVVRKTEAVVEQVYHSMVGDVLIPTSGETSEEISTASCIMLPGVILAGDLNIFRSTKIDGRIMSYMLNHIVNGNIARVAQGKSVVHVQASEISKIKISYPDPETQIRIIKILEAISNRIESCENELNQLSVLDEIIMYAFSEQHFRCLRNFPLSLSVHLKTGCAGKTKKLRLLEVPNDVLMHIPKLTTVTLINNEDNLFIFVGVHDL